MKRFILTLAVIAVSSSCFVTASDTDNSWWAWFKNKLDQAADTVYPVAQDEQQRTAQTFQKEEERRAALAASRGRSEPSGEYNPAGIPVKPYYQIKKPGAQ